MNWEATENVMNTKFNSRGFIAAARNLPWEYKIPDIKLVRDIRIKYGKVILDSLIARVYLSIFSTKPEAISLTINGINISIIAVKIRIKYSNSENIFLKKFRILSLSLFTM
jgi:hypothetical protein